MSKLTAIHKQIAALQAKAERITKQEMSSAIAKVKTLMGEYGVTIEHLTQSVVAKPPAKNAKAVKPGETVKAKPASTAKYADPKTGKTWSGFGRAPGWIANAKNRDEFLLRAVKAAAKARSVKRATAKSAASATKRLKAVAATKPAVKKAVSSKVAPKKKPAAKSIATKRAVKSKAAPKKSAPRKASVNASVPAGVESAPTIA